MGGLFGGGCKRYVGPPLIICIIVGQGPIALAVGAGWFGHFFSPL